MNVSPPPVRNSAIECLRIIAMVMIMSCHFATHGGFSFSTQTVTVPQLWWNLLEMGGNFGTNVFVIISGYFLINDHGSVFNFKRILKFWGQIVFYSVIIYLVFYIAGQNEFSKKGFIEMFFPITFNSWWFASTYFVLYLIHPFLNMLLRKLDKSTYQKLLVMLIIIWCIIPTFTTSAYQSNSLLWFVTLYSVAGYVRLFGLNPKFTAKHYFIFWLLFSVLRYLSCVSLIIIGTKVPFAAENSLRFYGTQSVLTFLSALSLFMCFETINMGNHKWINTIASATFGVYLIHDNDFVRPFLWQTLFKNAQYQDSLLLIPYSIFVVAIVYVSCTLIDLIRKNTAERLWLKAVDRYADAWLRPFEKIVDYFKGIVFGKEEKTE